MAFTQSITVQADSADQLSELLENWHRDQHGVAPGYQGSRLLAERNGSSRYIIEVDFASAEEAQQNNTRPETQAWADKLGSVVLGEPEYHDYEVAYRSA